MTHLLTVIPTIYIYYTIFFYFSDHCENNDDNPATASIIIAKDHEIEKLQSELNQLASAVKELKTEASETKGTQWSHFQPKYSKSLIIWTSINLILAIPGHGVFSFLESLTHPERARYSKL